MSRGEGAQLFIGRLSKQTRQRDLEDIFTAYGRLSRCDVKYGTGMAYAFVDYEDRRDAEDAIKYENGREVCGQSIVVEWARGPRRGFVQAEDECYKCHRSGHWARDCRDPRYAGFGRTSFRSPGGRGSGYRGGGSGGGGGFRRSSYRSRSRSRERESRNDRYRSRSRSRDRRDRDSHQRSLSRDHRRSRNGRNRSESPSHSVSPRMRSLSHDGGSGSAHSRSRSR
ncbi:uncharacterized protein LOC100376908 isoform X2 [Saccoglossus kowalevskii]|uniref:Serine/arginine-rich splicing factor RS2Z33-like isoform X2 n=1 Tax=Saccoglossus kowalevskii TaxID=10224 RepID=A0ABM0N0G3_SACKO|nr:PREDICTED: serine/arginine-rich splicing factor RS2Z33-like isoform X2 [Saccoglossus kowalevskii]